MYLVWDLLKMMFALFLFAGCTGGYLIGAAWIGFTFGFLWSILFLAVAGPIVLIGMQIAYDISETVDL
jgi:ABC-type transporter Mla maintaining outer membrane lipid asymmetry permease subunit MlaE